MSTVEVPILIVPAEEHRQAYLDFIEEFRAAGEPLWSKAGVNAGNVSAYIQSLLAHARGEDLAEGQVPQETAWLVCRGRILGDCHIRSRLTDALEDYGGHIGYAVRRSERRKGYGTLLLRLALDRARERGLRRVLVTCAADNSGSRRVIEKNGGRLASESYSEVAGRVTRRYWIEL